jgi:hypothetical protein
VTQWFDAPGTRNLTGLDYSVSARWTPRPRFRLTASGRRNVGNSTLLNASAVVTSDLSANATAAIGRKLLVGLETGFVSEDFRGIDRSNKRVYAELTSQYRLNGNLSAFAGASYRTQDAHGAGGRDYHGAAFRLGVAYDL